MREPVRAEGAAWSERERRFRLMFEAHYQAIHNYSVRRVESDHDAGDVAAEVFTTAWRRIDDVPPSPNELPWLYGVARRTISDLRRSQSRRASLVHRLRISRQPEVSPSSSDDPSHDRLLAAMAALPPDDCEALRLVLWEQLSHADTALVLDCSVNAVGIRIHRAKKRLRASLLPGTISDDERARGARFQSPVASSRDLRRSAVIAARIPNGRRRKYLVSALGFWFRGLRRFHHLPRPESLLCAHPDRRTRGVRFSGHSGDGGRRHDLVCGTAVLAPESTVGRTQLDFVSDRQRLLDYRL
jgi:RNA polymerase sigma-70 factor, ECF subfamily